MTMDIRYLLTLSFGAVMASLPVSSEAGPPIKTPVPNLYEAWRVAALSREASDAEARAHANQERGRVQSLNDPFTRLGPMTCAERAAMKPPERVVWEDGPGADAFMALVDLGDSGGTLLLTPKANANFLIDLPPSQLARLDRLAAATCDALVVAAGEVPSSNTSSCRIYVNPPAALSIGHLHVHVEARTAVPAPVDDAFLRRAAAHLRSLVGGKGCF